MNSRQLQYVITLNKTRSFSQASEQLNITQPALSKQILNLEKELGIKIFDRNTVPFTVTPAGEYFIREAEKRLYEDDQLLRSLEQYKSGQKGRLVIGVSPFRNLYMIPAIIKQFKQKYPGVHVVVHEPNSTQLRKDAAEGKYDFAIVNLPVDSPVLSVTTLEKEALVLAVPNEMVSRIPSAEKGRQIQFADCKDLPFVVVGKTQEMRRYFDSLCASTNTFPEIAAEVLGGVTTAWSMARAGIGATILPLTLVEHSQLADNLTLFTLSDTSFSRQPAIVTRRGQYLSDYAKYAIALLQQYSSLE
ncbi:MAG: LysR family transcriptional regulator [Oscillospiraceae bacterium]|nr:LysR family transcriptional regulator [Oscillospiraceae bacterium]